MLQVEGSPTSTVFAIIAPTGNLPSTGGLLTYANRGPAAWPPTIAASPTCVRDQPRNDWKSRSSAMNVLPLPPCTAGSVWSSRQPDDGSSPNARNSNTRPARKLGAAGPAVGADLIAAAAGCRAD